MRLFTQTQTLDKDQFIDLPISNATRLTEKGIVAAGDMHTVHRLHRLKDNFDPDGPMIGNVQRPGNTVSLNFNSARKNPIGMHSEAGASPRRGSRPVRR